MHLPVCLPEKLVSGEEVIETQQQLWQMLRSLGVREEQKPKTSITNLYLRNHFLP
ncbi:MAG TPA: hypothetical protein VGT05_02435 [Patescibacteria group bacterium]|nr:hypothetical protein [Patescibacteria group bacterium]